MLLQPAQLLLVHTASPSEKGEEPFGQVGLIPPNQLFSTQLLKADGWKIQSPISTEGKTRHNRRDRTEFSLVFLFFLKPNFLNILEKFLIGLISILTI